MSVKSEIDRIEQNVANTYNVLEDAGAEMPQARNTDNLSETAASIKAVLFKEQTLTEEQKAQTRKNIGVVETVTPQDYGAKGDGSTDDTVAFQNALANNRIVFVPGGTYKISGELVLGQNCQLELAQDVLLNFTQTSGNCISMKASSHIKGNHGAIKVPYEFTGRVINIYAGLDEAIIGVPPFTAWGPMWTAARYITDLHIVKLDYRGVAQSVNGECSGTAVYLGASTNDSMNFLWAVDLTRLRISGAFSYGIHMDTVLNGMSGWIHQTRISAFVDGAEVGVYAKDSTMSYLSVLVIPRRALTAAGEYVPYAKWGIYLDNCTDVDLSGSRVMDWDSTYSLWKEGNEYQHLALMGDCSGAILNECSYYAMSNYDVRSLIHTNRPSNLERLTILQEPFTRWFKPIDNVPYFNDGNREKKIALQEDLDRIVAGEEVANFTNALPSAKDTDGSIFNGIGYAKHHARLQANGLVDATDAYFGCTGFIKIKQNDVIYGKNIALDADGHPIVVIYDASFNYIMHATGKNIASTTYFFDYEKSDDGFKLTVKQKSNVAWVRFGFQRTGIGTNPAISVNNPITYSVVGYLQDGIKVKGENVVGGNSGGGSGADGEDGFSPVATVTQTSTGAVISITDANGTTTATINNGKDGASGQPGKDGYTPQKGVDYFDGSPGKDGEDGKPGADGYSPVKGKDYWTDADKAEMVDEVLDEIPEVKTALVGSTSDITPNDLMTALQEGRDAVISHTDNTYGQIYFTGFIYNTKLYQVVASSITLYNGNTKRFHLIGNTAFNLWNFHHGNLADYSDIPTKLPNPKSLTFTGAATGTYDGSSAMTVNIPTGSGGASVEDQISALIETDMLPSFHNGEGKLLKDIKGNVILRY